MWHHNNISSFFTVFLLSVLWGILLWNTIPQVSLLGIIYVFFLIIVLYICFFLKHIFFYALVWTVAVLVWLTVSLQHSSILNENLMQMSPYEWLYIEYSGKVHGLYKKRDFDSEYIISLQSIHNNVIDREIHHILRLPNNFTLRDGDIISYSWKMYPIEDFDGFAYKKFMLSKKIYFTTSANAVQVFGNTNSYFQNQFYDLRQDFLGRIQKIFPQREAIFLSWILFWARENIPQDLKEDFNNSWLTHFIAVSWFNITICIIFLSFFVWMFPFWLRFIIMWGCISLFAIFVWGWAPVVRASIMWILWYMFLESGNKVLHIPLLAFTAAVMTIMSPLSLSYDVSLHLSFLAVIGIIYTQDIFQKVFSFIPNTLAVREALVLTFAALSFSLPIMMFQFWQVSLLAPFANMAVTWTIPLAMLTGALTLIADAIHPVLWEILWYIAWTLLKFDMLMVHLFWNIEWALLKMDLWPFSVYLQSLYFIILWYVLLVIRLKYKR